MKIDLEGFEGLIKKTVLGDQGGKVVGLAGREEAHGRRIWIVIFFGLWTWIPSIRPAEQPARVPIFFSIKLGTEKQSSAGTQENYPSPKDLKLRRLVSISLTSQEVTNRSGGGKCSTSVGEATNCGVCIGSRERRKLDLFACRIRAGLATLNSPLVGSQEVCMQRIQLDRTSSSLRIGTRNIRCRRRGGFVLFAVVSSCPSGRSETRTF